MQLTVFQETLLRLDIILISVKVASNAIQQYGLYHQTDATPHQHRCGVKGGNDSAKSRRRSQ